MAYYCVFGGAGFFTAPTLGNLIAASKVRVTAKKMAMPSAGGFLFSQSGAGSSREFGILINSGELRYVYGSSTERVIFTSGEMVSTFGTAPYKCDLLDIIFDTADNTVKVFVNGSASPAKTVALVKGTGRIDGMLFRVGARCDNDSAASVGGGFITPNLTWVGDLKIYIDDALVRDYVIPSAGTIIPDVAGGNALTQRGTWPINDAEWVFYDAGGGTDEFTTSIVSNYPNYSSNIVTSVTKPDYTASIVVSYAGYTASVNSTNTKPIKTASIVSTYPSHTASVSATGGVSTYTVSVNTTYPKYTANVAVADVNKLSISTSYPAYTSNVISTNIKPIKTASVVGTYAKYTASVVATKFLNETAVTVNSIYPSYSVSSVLTNVDPIRSVSVNAAYPNYSAAFVVTNVDPIKSLVINGTYSKYSASVNAGTLIQDRTLVINSTYPTYIASAVLGEFASLPNIGGKGAHLVISLGSRDVKIKDKSRNVKWRVENARL